MKTQVRASLVAAGAALLAATLAAAFAPSASAAGSPTITLTPAVHSYGPVTSGTTASQTFTVTNTGGAATSALTVSLTSTAGSATAFTTTVNTCSGTSLGPRKSCSVTVQYAPTTSPQDDAATLTVTSKKPRATGSALLTGTGVAPLSQGQLNCEAVGGTYSTDPASNMVNLAGSVFLFSCNGGSNLYTFTSGCIAAGGNHINHLAAAGGGYNASCGRVI